MRTGELSDSYDDIVWKYCPVCGSYLTTIEREDGLCVGCNTNLRSVDVKEINFDGYDGKKKNASYFDLVKKNQSCWDASRFDDDTLSRFTSLEDIYIDTEDEEPEDWSSYEKGTLAYCPSCGGKLNYFVLMDNICPHCGVDIYEVEEEENHYCTCCGASEDKIERIRRGKTVCNVCGAEDPFTLYAPDVYLDDSPEFAKHLGELRKEKYGESCSWNVFSKAVTLEKMLFVAGAISECHIKYENVSFLPSRNHKKADLALYINWEDDIFTEYKIITVFEEEKGIRIKVNQKVLANLEVDADEVNIRGFNGTRVNIYDALHEFARIISRATDPNVASHVMCEMLMNTNGLIVDSITEVIKDIGTSHDDFYDKKLYLRGIPRCQIVGEQYRNTREELNEILIPFFSVEPDGYALARKLGGQKGNLAFSTMYSDYTFDNGDTIYVYAGNFGIPIATFVDNAVEHGILLDEDNLLKVYQKRPVTTRFALKELFKAACDLERNKGAFWSVSGYINNEEVQEIADEVLKDLGLN